VCSASTTSAWRSSSATTGARMRVALAACALVALAAIPATGGRAQDPAGSNDAALVSEFLAKVEEYVALHRKLDATLKELSPGAPAADVERHQRELEMLLRKARAAARPGNIFSRDVRAYFRRQISRAVRGPEGPAIRASIMEENPRTVRLTVNARYPDSLPVARTPTPILLLLPKLPEELAYRFMAERLVLLDQHAGTVVDYIDDALGR
jgi:hypothetical protein